METVILIAWFTASGANHMVVTPAPAAQCYALRRMAASSVDTVASIACVPGQRQVALAVDLAGCRLMFRDGPTTHYVCNFGPTQE